MRDNLFGNLFDNLFGKSITTTQIPHPSPPPSPPFEITNRDFLLSVAVVFFLVCAVAVHQSFQMWQYERRRRRQLIRCLGRSYSCPALDQLSRSAREVCYLMEL